MVGTVRRRQKGENDEIMFKLKGTGWGYVPHWKRETIDRYSWVWILNRRIKWNGEGKGKRA